MRFNGPVREDHNTDWTGVEKTLLLDGRLYDTWIETGAMPGKESMIGAQFSLYSMAS